jgi:hypothetical protein
VTVLWLYVVMASTVFGASGYEAVVHPAWSRKSPESFVGFVGAPISRMNISGIWMPAPPLFALSALAALAAEFWVGIQDWPLMLSATKTLDAIHDHNEARDAVTDAAKHSVDTKQWFVAVAKSNCERRPHGRGRARGTHRFPTSTPTSSQIETSLALQGYACAEQPVT